MKIKTLLAASLAVVSLHVSAQYTQAPLPYGYDALEPHIDARTMEIHYTKHHKAYVDNLNKAVAENNGYSNLTPFQLMKKITAATPAAIRNNGGGHWNHTFFWNILGPNKGGQPTGPLAEAIMKDFGSLDKFREEFNKAATTRFGSGWAWLVLTPAKKLEVVSTPNQDNPLMALAEKKGMPIIGLDVWEHAYYLKYQNKRPEYIAAFWNALNWDAAAKNYQEALGMK